jgi:hypothetical protein
VRVLACRACLALVRLVQWNKKWSGVSVLFLQQGQVGSSMIWFWCRWEAKALQLLRIREMIMFECLERCFEKLPIVGLSLMVCSSWCQSHSVAGKKLLKNEVVRQISFKIFNNVT